MKTKKDIRITVRLTPEQYDSIMARADTAQMTVGAYVRATAMRHKIVVVDGLKEFTHELKGIGRNLNQLAILANEGRVSIAKLDETYDELAAIYYMLEELVTQEQR